MIYRSHTCIVLCAEQHSRYSANMYELYLDGLIQDSCRTQSEFNLQIVLRPSENPDPQPVIFIGGVDDTVASVNTSLPVFTGCMKDLSYGYE